MKFYFEFVVKSWIHQILWLLLIISKIDGFLFWTGGTEYESWNIVDKVDKEDKLVENWTRGRRIPMDSVMSWNYCENYGHKMGDMGYTHSDKTTPAHLVG